MPTWVHPSSVNYMGMSMATKQNTNKVPPDSPETLPKIINTTSVSARAKYHPDSARLSNALQRQTKYHPPCNLGN